VIRLTFQRRICKRSAFTSLVDCARFRIKFFKQETVDTQYEAIIYLPVSSETNALWKSPPDHCRFSFPYRGINSREREREREGGRENASSLLSPILFLHVAPFTSFYPFVPLCPVPLLRSQILPYRGVFVDARSRWEIKSTLMVFVISRHCCASVVCVNTARMRRCSDLFNVSRDCTTSRRRLQYFV